MHPMDAEDDDAAVDELDKQALLPVNPFPVAVTLSPATAHLPASMPQAKMLHLIQQVFDWLEQPNAEDHSSDEQWLVYLHGVMLGH
ncbi:hypothetical protein WJX77_004852 [Trebouxia sp. C0004]